MQVEESEDRCSHADCSCIGSEFPAYLETILITLFAAGCRWCSLQAKQSGLTPHLSPSIRIYTVSFVERCMVAIRLHGVQNFPSISNNFNITLAEWYNDSNVEKWKFVTLSLYGPFQGMYACIHGYRQLVSDIHVGPMILILLTLAKYLIVKRHIVSIRFDRIIDKSASISIAY